MQLLHNLKRRLDLQAKVSLVLVAVILPTFLIVTVAQNKLTQPILEDEIRQIGVTSGKTLAAEIVSGRLLQMPNPTPAIESRMQEILYSQPNIVRVDVVVKDPVTGIVKVVASNVEEDPTASQPAFSLVEAVTSEYKEDENGANNWEISVPIEHRSRDPRGPRRLLGTVHLIVSAKVVENIIGTLWKTTATAAAMSVVCLILVLSYFLRKTIANDRLLRRAESQNIQLTEQLHDAQRQIMNTEKLAVMGQLTASFAHEIGTPLNAIGGHLQLLQEEIGRGERLEIINGQVAKIEKIVKGFLQSTAKPVSQKQLVDLNQLVEKTLGIARPRLEALGVELRRDFDRKMGPVRAVPLDLEQILLNLVNNSLDSLRSKVQARERGRLMLEISTQTESEAGKEWARVTVYDTGEGIKKTDLKNIFKPFFTTKGPGEGTGLGLTICQQLAHKYGGLLEIDSKEGGWTRVVLKIPYQV
ncbi:HAMP domain-containing sensor histidine kinase [Bdellovibrionota bacterium FG-1]